MDYHKKYDSSGRPTSSDWIKAGDDEDSKVFEVKNKALCVVLVKRHARAIVFRWKKIFG